MNSEQLPVLAVDIGGTNTKIAHVTSDARLSHMTVIPTASRDGEELVARIAAEAPFKKVAGVAVSVAGFLNDARDQLIYNPNLQWLVEFPLRHALYEKFKLPIAMEVDSNAACLAEYLFGSGRACKRFLCLTAGTGLGGGMIVDGELLRFYGACIGDVGHVIVDAFDGVECSCGGHGCAEAFVGTQGLARRANFPSFERLMSAREHGSVEAMAEIANAGFALGTAITSLAHIFAPERVAVAGGLSEAGDLLLSAARDGFACTAGKAFRRIEIVQATLGSKAPLIGAAAAYFREFTGSLQ